MLNIYQYKFKIINQKFEIQFFTKNNNIYIYMWGNILIEMKRPLFPCIASFT